MTLNPITALSDQLQKLINERGSAAILRDHLALFKDKIILLEQKASLLEKEQAVLKTENEKLKSEAANLRIANNELAAKIKDYENPAHKALLDEPKVKILSFLGTKTSNLTIDEIVPSVNLSYQATLYHLDELTRLRMLHNTHMPRAWSLAQEGRRYLIEHNLL